MNDSPGFEVIPGTPDSPVVLHVRRARTSGSVDTEHVALAAADRAAVRPWILRHDSGGDAIALARLVDERLSAAGEVTVVELCSFTCEWLPDGRHQGPRPEVGIGTDPFHTSDRLRNAAVGAMRPVTPTGAVAIDAPLSGCDVPAPHHGVRTDVAGVRLQLRHDLVTERGDLLAAGAADLLDAIAPR